MTFRRTSCRHAFLHFLLDPLPQQYPHVLAVKRQLYEKAAQAPRLAPDLKDDFRVLLRRVPGAGGGIKAKALIARRTRRGDGPR